MATVEHYYKLLLAAATGKKRGNEQEGGGDDSLCFGLCWVACVAGFLFSQLRGCVFLGFRCRFRCWVVCLLRFRCRRLARVLFPFLISHPCCSCSPSVAMQTAAAHVVCYSMTDWFAGHATLSWTDGARTRRTTRRPTAAAGSRTSAPRSTRGSRSRARATAGSCR